MTEGYSGSSSARHCVWIPSKIVTSVTQLKRSIQVPPYIIAWKRKLHQKPVSHTLQSTTQIFGEREQKLVLWLSSAHQLPKPATETSEWLCKNGMLSLTISMLPWETKALERAGKILTISPLYSQALLVNKKKILTNNCDIETW